jgi:hypothetical protein
MASGRQVLSQTKKPTDPEAAQLKIGDKIMPVSDCYHRDKPDVKIQVGLRGVDNRGKEHCETFHGPLCNNYVARTGRFGSAEPRWMLHQIMQRAHIAQPPVAKLRRGTVIPLRPVRAKPIEPVGTLARNRIGSKGTRRCH